MTALVIAMLLCLLAGLVVVGFVAVDARREGRGVLTPEGEELVSHARQRSEHLRDRGEVWRRRTMSSVPRPGAGRVVAAGRRAGAAGPGTVPQAAQDPRDRAAS